MKRNLVFFRRAVAAVLAVCVLLACGGCAQEPESSAPKLYIWVYSQEYADQMRRSFLADNPAIEWQPEFIVTEAGELDEKLARAQESGENLPDIIMLSPDALAQYTESDFTADLGELGLLPDSGKYYPYTVEMGKNSAGIQKAVCWQPDPGLFFYRRSMAKVYLGSDDPDVIAPMVSSWDAFLNTARLIKAASGGKTRMVAGVQDMMYPFMAQQEHSWIDADGGFQISEAASSFMDFAAVMTSEELCYGAEQWSQAWVSGISDTQSVFGYFTSGLGMQAILKKACAGTISGEGSFGDWAAVAGPSGYNVGGCWLAVRSGCQMTEQAGVFIRYFTSEQEAMRKYCLQNGQFSASRNVVEQIKYDPQFCESFLSGQNYYSLMADAAENVGTYRRSVWDSKINVAFADCVAGYAAGYKSRESALADFTTSANGIIAAAQQP